MMSDTVVSIYGGPTGVAVVHDGAVAVLANMLARAQAGEVIGVTVVALHSDGLASYDIGGMVGGYSVLGALDMALDNCRSIVRDTD